VRGGNRSIKEEQAKTDREIPIVLLEPVRSVEPD